MLISALKKLSLCTVLCSSEMVFMFIPKCSPPNKLPLDVKVIESFQYVTEEDELSSEEEVWLKKALAESEIWVDDE